MKGDGKSAKQRKHRERAGKPREAPGSAQFLATTNVQPSFTTHVKISLHFPLLSEKSAFESGTVFNEHPIQRQKFWWFCNFLASFVLDVTMGQNFAVNM